MALRCARPKDRAFLFLCILAAAACGGESQTGLSGELIAGASSTSSNLTYFGYYQADRANEVPLVQDHSTALIMESDLTDSGFARMRNAELKVFVSLASVFFAFDPNCGCQSLLDATTYEARWANILPVLRRNADVIAAFIPIDEPEFAQFPGSAELRRRDGLEAIAAVVRRDISGAKMAVNFWGTTVRSFATNPYEFTRRYPPSYDFAGTESYDSAFDPDLYRTLLRLTASVRQPAPLIYLVPKAFLNTNNPRFPQPDGEDGLVNRHLEQAFAFANAEPRVVGFFAFLFRTIPENGGTLHGANELSKVQAWMRSHGQALKNPTTQPPPPPSTGTRVRLWRLWNNTIRDHFYTASEAEANGAVASGGYRLEGESIYIYPQPGDGRVPFYRYLGNQGSDHFYTTRGGGAPLTAGDYRLEGIAGYVYTTPGDGRVRLYRYWSAPSTDHFYTTRGDGASVLPNAPEYKLEGEEIWVYGSPSDAPPSGASSWQPIPGRLKQIAVGNDGTVWGISAGDLIFRRVGDTWQKVGGSLTQIAVGNASQVWGVNASDQIYRRDGAQWTHIPGALKHVAVGNDGTVWGISAGDLIFRRVGDTWQKVGGSLTQIAVGNASQVWGVNASDQIYRRDGAQWTHIPGALKHVAVGNDGTVWGISAGDLIFRRVGDTWQKVDGSLTQIAVGNASQVWGVNASDAIYRWP